MIGWRSGSKIEDLGSLLASRFGLFRDDIIFYDLEHLAEALAIEFELGHVVFDAQGDLVDLDEERELTLAEGVEEFCLVVGYSEDGLAVGDEFDFGEMVVHVPCTPEIVPRTADPLDGKTVVEETLDNSQTHEVAKTVDASTTGPTVCCLYRRFH